jgi:hypothetical protein
LAASSSSTKRARCAPFSIDGVAEARVGGVAEAEVDGVGGGEGGEFVDVGFAREGVGDSGERAVGSEAQGALGAVVGATVVRDVVGDGEGGGAGIVVAEVPGGDAVVGVEGAADIDDAGRAAVGAREFFFAGPGDADGLAGGFREGGGFDQDLGAVLAAEGRAGVGEDDADAGFGDLEGGCDLFADAERDLAAGADGEALVVPGGDGGAGFDGRVGDGGECVGGLVAAGGAIEGGCHRSFGEERWVARIVVGFGFDAGLAEVVVEGGGRDEVAGFPFGFEEGEGAVEGVGVGGDEAGDVAFAEDADARDFGGRGVVERGEFAVVGVGAEHAAVEGAGAFEVARIELGAGDDVAAVEVGDRGAEDLPLRGRSEFDFERDLAAGGFERLHGAQGVARGGSGLADSGDGEGRGEAGEGAAIVGDAAGIGHDDADAGDGEAEFLGDALGKEGARALAEFALAGEEGDGAVGREFEAGSEDGAAGAGDGDVERDSSADGSDPGAAADGGAVIHDGYSVRRIGWRR